MVKHLQVRAHTIKLLSGSVTAHLHDNGKLTVSTMCFIWPILESSVSNRGLSQRQSQCTVAIST